MAKKQESSLMEMPEEEFIEHFKRYHKGKTLAELSNRSTRASKAMKTRGLDEMLINLGIITRVYNPKGFYSRMSDSEFVSYALQKYGKMRANELNKIDSYLYRMSLKRGLSDKICQRSQ